jgi:hypothetical protein
LPPLRRHRPDRLPPWLRLRGFFGLAIASSRRPAKAGGLGPWGSAPRRRHATAPSVVTFECSRFLHFRVGNAESPKRKRHPALRRLVGLITAGPPLQATCSLKSELVTTCWEPGSLDACRGLSWALSRPSAVTAGVTSSWTWSWRHDPASRPRFLTG